MLRFDLAQLDSIEEKNQSFFFLSVGVSGVQNS